MLLKKRAAATLTYPKGIITVSAKGDTLHGLLRALPACEVLTYSGPQNFRTSEDEHRRKKKKRG
jgi:hypothetical protein